jgi:hypothetical protein
MTKTILRYTLLSICLFATSPALAFDPCGIFGMGHCELFHRGGLDPELGFWTTEDSFAKDKDFCTRVYTCRPPHEMSDVITTPAELVRGVCSADGDPADSCKICSTNPPNTKCKWHQHF